MSKELNFPQINPLRPDDSDQYIAVCKLLYLLNKFTVRGAEAVRHDYEYEHYSSFYCIDCDVFKDDCNCAYDDHPYYIDDDRFEDEPTPKEPLENEEV